MKPPMVYEDTIPSAHIKTRITAIVHNIGLFLLFAFKQLINEHARLVPLRNPRKNEDSGGIVYRGGRLVVLLFRFDLISCLVILIDVLLLIIFFRLRQLFLFPGFFIFVVVVFFFVLL